MERSAGCRGRSKPEPGHEAHAYFCDSNGSPGPLSRKRGTENGCRTRSYPQRRTSDRGSSESEQHPEQCEMRERVMKANARSLKRRRGSGWLKNGNPPGDPNTAPRCGAKTRKGKKCRAPAMRNGRCRMHGGTSTGPRTQAGLARSRRARWKHGFCSAAEKAERRSVRQLFQDARSLLREA